MRVRTDNLRDAESGEITDTTVVAPMDERTLIALKGSIKKWKSIEAQTDADHGWFNCPLCALFNGDEPENDLGCEGCPVAQRAGVAMCDNTPYMAWANAHGDMPEFPVRADTPELMDIAREEREFLESLLP